MAGLSAYPAVSRALTRSLIEVAHPGLVIPLAVIVVLVLFAGPQALIYPETEADFKFRILILIAGSIILYRLVVTVYKLFNRGKYAFELREYAKHWGDEHEVLSNLDKILSQHRFVYCIVARGWVIAAHDLENKGFFPADQLSELSIWHRRSGYYLNAVLVDGRKFELSRTRRRAAIAYRAILKYHPKVRLSPTDKGAFERLRGMWSTWHGLHNQDPEALTLKKNIAESA